MTEEEFAAKLEEEALSTTESQVFRELEKERNNNVLARSIIQRRIDLMYDVLGFSISAVERQMKRIEDKIDEIEAEKEQKINDGEDENKVEELYKSELEKLDILMDKAINDKLYLENLRAEIDEKVKKYIDPIIKNKLLSDLESQYDDIKDLKDSSDAISKITELDTKKREIEAKYRERMSEEYDESWKELLNYEMKLEIKKINKRIETVRNFTSLTPDEQQNKKDEITANITKIKDIPEKDINEKMDEMSSLIKPLFTEYTNETLNHEIKNDVNGGNNLFKYIMSSTDVYQSLEMEINKLSDLLSERLTKQSELDEIEEEIKAEQKLYQEYKKNGDIEKMKEQLGRLEDLKADRREILQIVNMSESDIRERITYLQNEKIKLQKQQQIVLLSKQHVINMRNKKVAEYEQKAKQNYENGNNFRASHYKRKANKYSGEGSEVFAEKEYLHELKGHHIRAAFYRRLSNIKSSGLPIFESSSTVMIISSMVKAQLSKKSLIKKGMLDGKMWEDVAIEELEKKSGKSL